MSNALCAPLLSFSAELVVPSSSAVVPRERSRVAREQLRALVILVVEPWLHVQVSQVPALFDRDPKVLLAGLCDLLPVVSP